jgi:GT2 family glycosyltransferase
LRAPAEFSSARLLVRLAGAPVGFIEVPLVDGEVGSEVLLAAVNGSLAAPLADACEREGLTSGVLTVAGLSLPGPSRYSAPGPYGEPTPFASVVICTFDRAESLKRVVDSVLLLDYPSFELVVVDNAPARGDATRLLIEGYDDERLRYVPEPVAGLSRARNRGVSEARGELIVFTDDDVVADAGWLRALAAAFTREPHVGLVTGLVPTAELRNEFQQQFDQSVHWSSNLERKVFDLGANRPVSPTFPFRTGLFGTGASFATTRSALRSVGKFDEALGAGTPTGGGEDLDFFLRVVTKGWQVVIEPTAIVWHFHRADRAALERQMATYGSGATAYMFKHAFDPRNVGRLISSVAHWRRKKGDFQFAAAGDPEGATLANDPALAKIERRGWLRGPSLYMKGRRAARKWPEIPTP